MSNLLRGHKTSAPRLISARAPHDTASAKLVAVTDDVTDGARAGAGGRDLPEKDVDQIFNEWDLDHNGQLEFEELKKVLSKR